MGSCSCAGALSPIPMGAAVGPRGASRPCVSFRLNSRGTQLQTPLQALCLLRKLLRPTPVHLVSVPLLRSELPCLAQGQVSSCWNRAPCWSSSDRSGSWATMAEEGGAAHSEENVGEFTINFCRQKSFLNIMETYYTSNQVNYINKNVLLETSR